MGYKLITYFCRFDYFKTLVAWEKKFDLAWPKLEAGYGARFHKMWKMYLHM